MKEENKNRPSDLAVARKEAEEIAEILAYIENAGYSLTDFDKGYIFGILHKNNSETKESKKGG